MMKYSQRCLIVGDVSKGENIIKFGGATAKAKKNLAIDVLQMGTVC